MAQKRCFVCNDFAETSSLMFLFMVTFCVVLPWMCSDWVYSPFFDGDEQDKELVKRAMDLNDARLQASRSFFSHIPEAQEDDGDGIVDIAIAVIATHRSMNDYTPGYLTQTMHALHQQAHEDRLFPHKRIFICNVDPKPSEASEILHLAHYFKTVERFGGAFPEEVVSSNKFNKSKDDYAFCMKIANSYGPSHILVMEDDAVIKSDFFTILFNLLHTKLQILEERDHIAYRRNWAYMKLYYPQKWQGYSAEWDHYVERTGVWFTGGMVFVALRLLMSRYGMAQQCKGWSLVKWFLAGGLYCTALSHGVGRPYLIDLLDVSPYLHRLVHAPDCCTQAIVYPTEVVTKIVRHLYASAATMDRSHDLVIDSWADDNDFERYLTLPNMVQHIGMVSTVRQWAKKAAYFIY